jgi:hypothetical protein
MKRSAVVGIARPILVTLIVLVPGRIAHAQGPDLVQVTFSRAFGKAPLGPPFAHVDTTTPLMSAIAAGRAAAELPGDTVRRAAFVKQLDEMVLESSDGLAAKLVIAVMEGSLGDLTDDRAYLHARLAEVNSTLDALLEQRSEMADVARRMALPGPGRNTASAPVTILNVDMRLFGNDDSKNRRSLSCDPCYTRRRVPLRAVDVEREMMNAENVQARVLARREELLSRGLEFNRRALAVVALFADVLRQLDERKGGALKGAIR